MEAGGGDCGRTSGSGGLRRGGHGRTWEPVPWWATVLGGSAWAGDMENGGGAVPEATGSVEKGGAVEGAAVEGARGGWGARWLVECPCVATGANFFL